MSKFNNVFNYINRNKHLDMDYDDILYFGLLRREIQISSYMLAHNLEELCLEMDRLYNTDLTFGFMRFMLKLMSHRIFEHDEVMYLTRKYKMTRHSIDTYTNLSKSDRNEVRNLIRQDLYDQGIEIKNDEEKMEASLNETHTFEG